MIATILMLGVLAGMDNLQVCSSVGLLPVSRRRIHRLAAGFILCEMTAPWLGLLAGHALLGFAGAYARVAAAALMALGGLAVFAGRDRTEPRFMSGLPVSLSVDNLAAGVGMSALPCPVWVAGLTIGLVSAAMSCLGLYGAAGCRRWLRRFELPRLELAVGVYLCVLAARMLLVNRA